MTGSYLRDAALAEESKNVRYIFNYKQENETCTRGNNTEMTEKRIIKRKFNDGWLPWMLLKMKMQEY